MMERFRLLRYSFEQGTESVLWRDLVKTKIKYHDKGYTGDRIVKDMYNFYEMIAIGIKHKWMDENIIKTFWRHSYVMDWPDFRPAVRSRQNDVAEDIDGETWSEVDKLAKRWAKNEAEKRRLRP